MPLVVARKERRRGGLARWVHLQHLDFKIRLLSSLLGAKDNEMLSRGTGERMLAELKARRDRA